MIYLQGKPLNGRTQTRDSTEGVDDGKLPVVGLVMCTHMHTPPKKHGQIRRHHPTNQTQLMETSNRTNGGHAPCVATFFSPFHSPSRFAHQPWRT